MSQVINTNVLSLNAQRNLNQTQGDLAQSLERLSSGLRINSAKDDAAGLAISERFTTQINGLNQAVRNSNDGISFAQTAEGALDTIGDALQRARQLAVQSANDTKSASDRQAINDEVQQLMEEVSRVANSAEFNGGRILDGTVEDLFFQVGANQGQTIAVDGVDARTSQLGATEVVGSGGLTQEQIAEIDEVNPDDVFEGPFDDITISSDDFEEDIEVLLSGDEGEGIEAAATLEDAVRIINAAITEAASAGDENAKDVADADLEAALRVKNDGTTTIAITSRLGTENLDVTNGGVSVDGNVESIFVDDEGEDVTLNDVDVVTRETATQSIGAFDGALTKVNSLRAELGAVQTRFESTIANLEIGSENLSDARSRIRDADFAAETAELSRAQVLQQAGTTVLSQANAVPQNVLGLLQ